MAKKRAKGVGCLFLLICLAGGYMALRQKNPALAGLGAVLIGVFILGALIFAVISAWPKSCAVCGIPIKKQSYSWKIEGEQKRVCPNCNRTLERRQSQRATRNIK